MRFELLREFIQCEFVILGSLVLYFDGAHERTNSARDIPVSTSFPAKQ